MASDLDALKDIPGYKTILKTVLKSQVQLLLEQLSEQTGEESIILTASMSEGTLSHQGSHTGLGFLEGHKEVKSQFLRYCLTSHHKHLASSLEDQHQQNSSKGSTQNKSSTSTQRQPRPMPYDRPSSKSTGPSGAKKPNRPSKNNLPRSNQRNKESEYSQPRSGTRTTDQSHIDFASQGMVDRNSSNLNQTEFDTKDFLFNDGNTSIYGSTLDNEYNRGSTSAGPRRLGSDFKQIPPLMDDFSSNSASGNDNFMLDTKSVYDHFEESAQGHVKLEAYPTRGEKELGVTEMEPGSWSHDPLASTAGALPDLSYSHNQGNLEAYSSYHQGQFSDHPQPHPRSQKGRSSVANFTCQFCSKEFQTNALLNEHKKSHKGGKPYQCLVCKECFKMKTLLISHMYQKHKNVAKKIVEAL